MTDKLITNVFAALFLTALAALLNEAVKAYRRGSRAWMVYAAAMVLGPLALLQIAVWFG